LIASQPAAFAWSHKSTLSEPSKPILYVKSDWSEHHKAKMLERFEKDLKANTHVSDKVVQALFST